MISDPEYNIVFYTDNELHFSSYLQAGLYDLSEKGIIRYSFQIPHNRFKEKEILCSRIKVTDRKTGVEKIIAFDWADSPRTIYRNKLGSCDSYYKRNLIPGVSWNFCPADQKHKIKPLGLVINCRSEKERPFWVRLLGAFYTSGNSHGKILTQIHNVKKIISQVRTSNWLMKETQFFNSTNSKIRDIILFQTRAYDPEVIGNPHDSDEITSERAEIIRFLRKELGGKVVAGFTPSEYTRRVFPDLVINENIEQKKYLELVRTASICIYSRGLNDSPALKLGEYLAAGKCIVSPTIPTLLPRPLKNNEQIVYHESLSDLVDQCQRLLDSPEIRKQLEEKAFEYYLQEISPASRLMTILDQEFRNNPTT